MTHDELLAKIDFELKAAELEDICGCPPTHKALRAVVELHHPLYYRHGEIETRGAKCSDCNIEYPCPTIQAIEKELQ